MKNFIFIWISSKVKIILIAMFLRKSHTWEKSGSLDMCQNASGQLDSRIFKSVIKQEKKVEST